MKKEYVKPVAETVEFQPEEKIMAFGEDVETSTGLEEW